MININYKDPRPIYEQVKDAIRRMVVSGVLMPDEKLPSVRELASQGSVNPNTVQRAYRELESEGYIYSVPGKGSFVSERQSVDTSRRDALLKRFDEIVVELHFLGIEGEALSLRISNSSPPESKQIPTEMSETASQDDRDEGAEEQSAVTEGGNV